MDIPDQLAAQADARGVPVETYVRGILEQAATVPVDPPRRVRTPGELDASFERFAQFSDKTPDLLERTSIGKCCTRTMTEAERLGPGSHYRPFNGL